MCYLRITIVSTTRTWFIFEYFDFQRIRETYRLLSPFLTISLPRESLFIRARKNSAVFSFHTISRRPSGPETVRDMKRRWVESFLELCCSYSNSTLTYRRHSLPLVDPRHLSPHRLLPLLTQLIQLEVDHLNFSGWPQVPRNIHSCMFSALSFSLLARCFNRVSAPITQKNR